MNTNQLRVLQGLSNAFVESLKNNNHVEKIRKLEKIESFLEQCIQDNPTDIEAYIRLAIVVSMWPLKDYQKAIDTLKKALIKEPNNNDVIVILAYLYDVNLGFIDEDIWEKLRKIQSSDLFIQARIEQAKAWYYRGKYQSVHDVNARYYIWHLEKTIELDPNTVIPYIRLGKFYLDHNNINQGKKLIEKGLANIVYVGLWRMESKDVTSIKDFFDINFRGIYITPEYYEIIKEWIV